MIELWNAAAALVWREAGPALWQTSVVALVVLVAMRLSRRWPARVRHAFAVIALLKFAVPTLIPAPVAFAPLASFVPSAAFVAPLADRGRSAESVDGISALRAFGADSNREGASASMAVPASSRPTVRAWMLLAYLLGALWVAARIAAQAQRLRRSVRAGTRIAAGTLHETVEVLGASLGLKRRLRLIVSRRAKAPVAFGCLFPTILVPHRLVDALPERELRAILAHELAHHRRGDLWLNALQCVLAVIWWFDPLFWFVSRELRGAREDCCDDVVLARGLATPAGYCETLLRAARVSAGLPSYGAALACHFGSHPLRWRVSRIMRPGFRPAARVGIVPAAVLGALAFVLLPGAATRSSAHSASDPYENSRTTLDRNDGSRREPAPDDLDRALRSVRAADPTTRAFAARALGELHATAAIPHLIALLGDDAPVPEAPPWSGREWSPARLTWSKPSPGEAAAISLASMSVDAAFALIDALRASQPSARRNAAWALGELHAPRWAGLPEVLPLLAALQDEAADVRAAAAWALGETKDRRATAPLCAALHDRDAAVRGQAAHALGELADPHSTDALREALDDASPGVRRAASWALDEIADRIGNATRRRGN